MRIALRTGGGRGVFELAGQQGSISASSLFGLQLFYEITPNIILPGHSTASLRQGKPRIKLDDTSRTTHLYRLLSAILLIPKPKREFSTTVGGQLFKTDAFSMTAIKVDIGRRNSESVVLRPTQLLLETADSLRLKIGFAARMGRITQLWEVASHCDSELARLISEHKNAILEEDPNYKVIEKSANAVFGNLAIAGDPLLEAEDRLKIIAGQIENSVDSNLARQSDFGLEDEVSPSEARIERIKEWRLQAIRGYKGNKFRIEVSQSYGYTVLFTGERLPRLAITESAGVDAAHILPWSTYDINCISNGICINKQCHWAFDQGIIRLTYDAAENVYLTSIPVSVREAAIHAQFDLAYFENMAGIVPVSRLPKQTALWPSPRFLDELNAFMDLKIQ